MNQAEIKQALEPLVDAIVALEKRVDALQLTPGPAGADGASPPAGEVAKALIKDYADVLRGAPGKDADPVTVCIDDVADALRKSGEFLQSVKGDTGPQGMPGDCGPQGLPGINGADGLGINSPVWRKGIYREGVTVQHHIGRRYIAKRDTTEEPGNSDDWERIGTDGFRFRNTKREGVTYEEGDLYIDQGTTFIITDGKPHMFARRGKDGTDGIQGVAGTPGRDAPRIVDFVIDEKGIVLAFDDGSIIESAGEGLAAWIKNTLSDGLDADFIRDKLDRDAPPGSTPLRRFRGDYDTTSTYAAGDVVMVSGALWLASQDWHGGNFDSTHFARLTPMTPPAKAIPPLPAGNTYVMSPSNDTAVTFPPHWRHQVQMIGHVSIGDGAGFGLALTGIRGFSWDSVKAGHVQCRQGAESFTESVNDMFSGRQADLLPDGVLLGGGSYASVSIHIATYSDTSSMTWQVYGTGEGGTPVTAHGVAIWEGSIFDDLAGVRLSSVTGASVTAYMQAGGF